MLEPRHPQTGEPFTELERVLWRFRMAAHEATTMWRGFNSVEDVERDINSELMLGLTNQCLIIVTKFREVWDDFGSVAKDDPRVVLTRRAVQPLVDRIDVWPGLRDFRNTALAHAYQDKAGKLVPPTALIRSGAAPTFHAEIILLMQLVVFGVLAVLLVFDAEYRGIDNTTRDAEQLVPTAGPGIALGSEIDRELRRIAHKVQAGLDRELGVTPGGDMMEMFKNALRPRDR
ncbi:MAG: hypothetical protein O7D29_13005 [Gemmatimonadetes bacterium]|nr:hypothetical protein [Gemmatimonadota bacterium]